MHPSMAITGLFAGASCRCRLLTWVPFLAFLSRRHQAPAIIQVRRSRAGHHVGRKATITACSFLVIHATVPRAQAPVRRHWKRQIAVGAGLWFAPGLRRTAVVAPVTALGAFMVLIQVTSRFTPLGAIRLHRRILGVGGALVMARVVGHECGRVHAHVREGS